MKFSRHWLWLLLLIPAAIGFMRLRLDVEVMNLLPDDLAVVRGLKLYQAHFANSRELIITVEATEAETSEAAARILALALRQSTNLVTQAVWQPLWLENPGQSAELVAFLWLNQPPEVFGALTNRFTDQNLPRLLAEAQEALTTSLSPQDLVRRGYDPLNLTQLPETGSGTAGSDGHEFFEIVIEGIHLDLRTGRMTVDVRELQRRRRIEDRAGRLDRHDELRLHSVRRRHRNLRDVYRSHR